MTRGEWTPLLDGALAGRAMDLARGIADDLIEWAIDAPDLGAGATGLAVTFAALDQTFPGSGYGDPVGRLLEGAGATVHARGPSLYHGFTGFAWALELLGGGEEDVEDPNGGVDEWLAGWLARSPWLDDFDLMSGLVGIGLYALERGRRGATCLAEVVTRLDELATEREDGIVWPTPSRLLPPSERARHPEGYLTVGLAHGAPGVAVFLAAALRAGEARARPLLEGTLRGLGGQELDGGGYPHHIFRRGPSDYAGLRWCYGDLGVALALWSAGDALGDPAARASAVDLARAAARRGDLERMDAGLCHGTAGVAHIYNRLWQASGDGALAEMAVWAMRRAIEDARPGHGIGGYRFASPQGWEDRPGLLQGSAGVALALVAAATPLEPSWDRVMLLSAR